MRTQNGSTIRYGARWVVILLALTLAGTSPTPGSAAAATAPDGIAAAGPAEDWVTWPQFHSFNPEVHDYVITTDYAGARTLRLRMEGPRDRTIDLPSVGATVVPFSDRWVGAGGTLTVISCDARGECRDLSARIVQLHDRVIPRPGLGEAIGPRTDIVGRTSPSAAMDVRWTASTEDDPGTSVASGTVSAATRGTGIGDQPALEQGVVYHFAFHYRLEGERWGVLEAAILPTLVWDDEVSGTELEIGRVDNARFNEHDVRLDFVPGNVIYPYEDGYGDAMYAFVYPGSEDRNELVTRLEVRSPTGRPVHSGQLERGRGGLVRQWNARRRGEIEEEGRYRVLLTVTDGVGNVVSLRRRITVSDDRLVYRPWRHGVTPASSMIDSSVGRCADLRRPARAGWAGSLGYRTDDRCSRNDEWGVGTVHGAWVPNRLLRWGKATISLDYRGAAVGAPSAYTVSAFQSARGQQRWVYDRNRRSGAHVRGAARPAVEVLHEVRRGKSYLPFFLGTTGGHDYDLRTFEVVVRHRVLVDGSTQRGGR